MWHASLLKCLSEKNAWKEHRVDIKWPTMGMSTGKSCTFIAVNSQKMFILLSKSTKHKTRQSMHQSNNQYKKTVMKEHNKIIQVQMNM